jgi:hypothetical protein
MIFIASISYALSIFIDLFSYHIKFYIQDKNNVRYLLSLVSIFQYSARAFVLIFVPIMAYFTETVKDKNIVWSITLMSHVLVVLFLLPLFSHRFTSYFSKLIINILNILFGKSKVINLKEIVRPVKNKIKPKKHFILKDVFFFSVSFVAGFLFSVSITFLYYLSFSYPQKALTLSSFTQIINVFGSLIFVLFIDPKIMGSIDKEEGYHEIKLLTKSRIFAHLSLIILLYFIK